MTLYLSVEQLLRIHAQQASRFGGATGVRDEGALEAAVARPQATFGGEDLYPDLAAKAAALLHSLVASHPLVDGNKRTAAMAAELLLLFNGYELAATDDMFEEVVMATARGQLDAEALAIWIRQRIQRIE